MQGDDGTGDVERTVAVTRPARDEHVGGATLVARDEAGAPLQGGAEAGVGGVLVHDAGDSVVVALNTSVAAVLAGERVVALRFKQLAAAVERAANAVRTEGQPQPELDSGSKVAWL